MKQFLLYVLLALMSSSVFATSIVIYVTPDYVVLAADSRRIILDEKAGVAQKLSVCKIHCTGNYCYTLAGMTASGYSFSAEKIINGELIKTGNYTKAVARIKKEISKALQNELLYQKQFRPDLYKRSIASKDHILETVIIRRKNNKPEVLIIGFEFTDEDKIDVKSYSNECPGGCPEQPFRFYFLGDYSGIEQYFATNPSVSDPVTFVEKLIEIQAQATPSSVSTPVNIVKFSNKGVEWIK